ncbi:MAG: hypothetical protein OXT72_07015 [Gammaproteobacteria bacterium]|nr:hypothetical protein [Gammaproteobacteria bacterium]MDE0247472.1 hypothetical protein [Gammaproteobacteria bacterium]
MAPSLATGAFSKWLEEQREAVADRWLVEIRARTAGIEGELLHLLADFIDLFTLALAPGVGVFRGEVERVLKQAAVLYGNLGAHRGLAAGEPVEEMQLLGGVLLRFLYGQGVDNGVRKVGLRDLLQLNRLADLVVTYASIGHTDTLFFNQLHAAGVAEGLTPDILAEVREQVEGIHDELSLLIGAGHPDGWAP